MESSTSSKPSLNDHWLYRIVPRHQENLTLKRPWEYITWTLFGNDNDGIFGEGPKSGTKWIERWKGTIEKEYEGTIEKTKKVVKFDPGNISFKRFVMWQLRNPLHNFTFYVIGFAARKDLPLFKLALISTKEISFFQRLKKTTPFPMGINSGIYFGLHMLPFVSFRLNLFKWRWLEGYTGWRPNGAFGFFALRLKKLEDSKNEDPKIENKVSNNPITQFSPIEIIKIRLEDISLHLQEMHGKLSENPLLKYAFNIDRKDLDIIVNMERIYTAKDLAFCEKKQYIDRVKVTVDPADPEIEQAFSYCLKNAVYNDQDSMGHSISVYDVIVINDYQIR